MIQKKLYGITFIALMLASLVLMLTAYGAVNVSTNINSSGSIVAYAPGSSLLGLYSDSACTIHLAPIDWGSLSPGATISRNVYIKNEQGAVSLSLNMATSNWTPTTANGPMTLTWNRQGTVLAPGKSTMATITLQVSSSIAGISSFGVQIIISGTG
jgi:hypothetical protein